jgi:hypothetical protein
MKKCKIFYYKNPLKMSGYVPRKRYGTSTESGLKLEDMDVRYVNEKGDKMKGPLDMNGNKITNVSSPVEDNEVINKEYFKKQLDKKVEKTKTDIANNIEKTKTDIKEDLSKKITDKIEKSRKDITMMINDQVANKDDITKLKDEIKDIIQSQIQSTIQSTIKSQIQSTLKESLKNIEKEKIDDEKKLHAKLRNAYLSLIPKQYNIIINHLHPIWREPPFATEEKKYIYLPGDQDKQHIFNLSYNLPKNCTIFMVVKFFDNVGLIYIKKDEQYIFSLSQLFVVHFFEAKVVKTLEIGKQYSIVIGVKEHKIKYIKVVNDGILELVKPNIIFDQLQLGLGRGLIYDLIIHDKLLEDEKIDEIVKSLNKIHKISS